jgi:adenine phosphoribosyltransferase
MDFKSVIRTIPDYPKPGIMFRDVTTLLGNARAFRTTVDQLVQPYAGMQIDKVAGIEARGFILAGAVAHQLSVGFVPVRKKGKLPWKTIAQTYDLEYGTDTVEIHEDAVQKGENVLLVDDLIATGGTAEAAIKLIEKAGGHVVGCSFIIDLPELKGRRRLEKMGKKVLSLVEFEGHWRSTAAITARFGSRPTAGRSR